MVSTIIDKEIEIETLKQSFYIVSKEQNSIDIYNDLDALFNQKVFIIVVINPHEITHRNTIDVLKYFQKEKDLPILLKEVSNLEKTPFIIKEYHNELNLSGLCDMDADSILYIGEDQVFFDLFYIGENPLYTLETINMAKNSNGNIGIASTSDNFNISTFTLASKEIEGSSLEIPNYNFQVDKPSLVHRSFYYIGDIAIIFFIVSILILLVTIGIFKKWSQENFLP